MLNMLSLQGTVNKNLLTYQLKHTSVTETSVSDLVLSFFGRLVRGHLN